MNRTLLDIIREEERHGSLFGHRDKKSWKAFRDSIRIKRAGEAWTSSIPVPTSDMPIQNTTNNRNNNNQPRSLMARRSSVRFTTVPSVESDEQTSTGADSRLNRGASTRIGNAPSELDESSVNVPAVEEGPPMRSFMPQFSRHNSTRCSVDQATASAEDDDCDLGYRMMSARQAVAAQEASEAAAQAEEAAAAAAAAAEAASAAEEKDEEAPLPKMSLEDLLGSIYPEDEDDDEEYGEEAEYKEYEEEGSAVEVPCCVCRVEHTGSAFVPCGHTFCRMCSRELLVQRGNCPRCNAYILEILDIF